MQKWLKNGSITILTFTDTKGKSKTLSKLPFSYRQHDFTVQSATPFLDKKMPA